MTLDVFHTKKTHILLKNMTKRRNFEELFELCEVFVEGCSVVLLLGLVTETYHNCRIYI